MRVRKMLRRYSKTEDEEKTASTGKDLRRLQEALQVAPKMEAVLGPGSVLQ